MSNKYLFGDEGERGQERALLRLRGDGHAVHDRAAARAARRGLGRGVLRVGDAALRPARRRAHKSTHLHFRNNFTPDVT